MDSVQQLTAALHAQTKRAEMLEELTAQTLALLSVARIHGADCTEEKINAWHKAVALCGEGYGLIKAGNQQ